MQQLVLFETDHVAIVREILDRTPEFGPGDKVLIADDGVTTVIIDRIVEECGTVLYECHTDSLTPVQVYLEKEEIFSNKEYSRCKKAWETLESKFKKISPDEIGVEKCIAVNVFLTKSYMGNRSGRAVFSVLSNGMVYVEGFHEPAYLIECEDSYDFIKKEAEKFKEWAHERDAYVTEDKNAVHKDVFFYNEKWSSWDGIKNEIPNLRELRKAI